MRLIDVNSIIRMLNTMDRYTSGELTLCDTNKTFPKNEVFVVDDVYEGLDELPTIEPEPHWILCSERLPEENGQYLITVKYVHVDGYDDIYAEHGEWTDGKWDMFCFGHCGKVENIIAWMPLPEAYKEGEG